MDHSAELEAYGHFFDICADMMCVAGADGVFEKANPAFCAALGMTLPQITSVPFIDLVHPDDVDSTLDAWQAGQRGTTVINFRNRYRHTDGHYLVLDWSARWDESHQRAYAVARDITAQAAFEARIASMEQALFDNTIYARTDVDGVITHVSDQFCEVSGFTRDELIGQTHSIVNSGEHSPAFFQGLWQTIASGRVWRGLIKNRKKSGEPYFVQSVIFPVWDTDGSIREYHAIRQDITEIIQGRSEHKRILSILNETNSIAKIGGWELEIATGDLNWTDETFEILEVEKLSGQKPVLAEGLQLFTDDYSEIMTEAVNRGVTLGEPYSLEVQALTAKGNVKWVYTNGRANYVDGEIVSLSGTIQDIDHRKRAELQLAQERQKSIHNAKLASLGELAASVAHEINNPLAVISGHAEMLNKTASRTTPEKIQHRGETIHRSCERISQMVRTLKKYSRQEEDTEKVLCDLSSVVDEAMLLTASKAKRQRVAVEVATSETAQVMGNEIQLEQVVINLINNGIDAVADLDDRRVEVNISPLSDGTLLSVTDSGVGIPAEIAAKMFDSFFTTKQAGEGTGLGLAIISDILADHGASIWQDKASPNTCFKIRFPQPGAVVSV